MIKYIKFLFKRKNELERYVILVEKANEYYSRNSKAILGQCGRKVGGIDSFANVFNDDSNTYLFFSRGSKMEN